VDSHFEGNVHTTMLTSSTKKRIAIGLAAASLMSTGIIAGSASADPQQPNAAVGVGSDTIQDIANAFAGQSNNIFYTPLASGAATSNKQLVSFDATIPSNLTDTCITTKLGGPTFTRPNGSGAGRKALYASSGLSAVGWTGSAITQGANVRPTCATAVDISGQVDFARSSAGPAAGDLGTDLTYIPFGRDGVSFAYYQKTPTAGSPTITALTSAQLNSLFTTGPQTIGGTRIVPCGIQTSSGTYTFWNTATGATAANEATSTAICNAVLAAGRAEENDSTQLKARGDALALLAGETNSEVIIGYSAAKFTSQANGLTTPAIAATAGIGSIDAVAPVTGSAPSVTPNSAFYSSATYGRNVYIVLPTTVATGAGNAAIKALFVGSTSAICAASATTTQNAYGFLANASCGSTATKGSWITGAS
jgi:hypothetical protein